MTHGETVGVEYGAYITSEGKEIEIGETVRDLGVIASENMMFREHIEKVVTSARVKVGILMRTFSTRHEDAMMKMFNT